MLRRTIAVPFPSLGGVEVVDAVVVAVASDLNVVGTIELGRKKALGVRSVEWLRFALKKSGESRLEAIVN